MNIVPNYIMKSIQGVWRIRAHTWQEVLVNTECLMHELEEDQ